MSPGLVREWWPGIALLINVLALWIMWSLRQQFVTRKHCNSCQEKLDARVSTLEQQKTCVDIKLDNLPQMEAMHEMSLRQEQLSGEIAALKATIEGLKELLKRLERPLDLMVEGHLNGKGGKG